MGNPNSGNKGSNANGNTGGNKGNNTSGKNTSKKNSNEAKKTTEGKPTRPGGNSNPRTGGGKNWEASSSSPSSKKNNPRTGGGKPAKIDGASTGPVRPPKKGVDGIGKNLPAGDNSEDNAIHRKGEQTQAAGRGLYDAGEKLEKVADKSKNAKTAAKAAKASNVAKKASSKASTAGTVINVAGDAVNAGKKMKQGDVAGATDDVIRGATTGTAEFFLPTVGGTVARTILDSAPGRFASRNLAKFGVGAAGIAATSILMIVVIVIALVSTLLSTLSMGAASACADGGSSNSSPVGGDVSDPGSRTAAKYFWDELKKAGYSEYSAAGIIGNLYQESRFKPREDNGSHVGIAQWSNGADGNRWGDLKAYVATKKLDPYSIKGQIAFLIYEAANSYNMPELMKAAKSPEEAAEIWVKVYEGASGQQNAERDLFAKQWYDSLKNNRPFAGVGMITGFTSNIISLVAPSIIRTIPASSKKLYWPVSPWPGASSSHDIGVPVGTPVYAVADGTVVISEDIIGNQVGGYASYGRYVKIQHNMGMPGPMVYAHLSERKVKTGQKVKAGQLIGISGETGHTFGAHLHIDFNADGNSNETAIPWLQEHGAVDPPAGGVAGGGGDVAPPVKPTIVDHMMANATKPLYKENIRKYAMRHYGTDTYTLTPKGVVLHWTGGPGGSGLGNLSTWDQDSSSGANANGEPSPPPAAHFIIEQDGTIYQVMPTNLIVRHALGVNDVAIGIEFVDTGPATNILARQKQLDSGLALVRWLMYENKIPVENILGHGTVNESPLFHDKVAKNDHTDWVAPEVEKFKSLIGEIGTGNSGKQECQGSGGAGSGSAQNEESPRDCPATAPPGTINVAGDPKKLCEDAVRNAATPEAARAIKYAFKNLGAPYSQQNRTGSNPNVYDCSSFVARAYDAAGAKIKRGGAELGPWLSVFGYTGAYMPSIYDGTNLQRVMKKEDMRPGDIIIQFAGADPGNSAGNAGHAQIYLGNDIIIESTSPVSDVRAYGQWAGDNMWYFRYNSAK